MKTARWLLSALAATAVAASLLAADANYAHEIDQWRAKREEGLRAPDGWLSVVGLHWLHEGTSAIGSAKGSDVILPADTPARVGTIEVAKGHAVFHAAPGVPVKSKDKPVDTLELRSD